MKLVFCVLPLLFCSVMSILSPPQVMVYSNEPTAFGAKNTLICKVKNFHPPEIVIELLKNDMPIPNSNLTDLSFNKEWRFHLTRFAEITPTEGDKFLCRVTHNGKSQNFNLEPNM